MLVASITVLFFFSRDPATTNIYTLSLHDALPILMARVSGIFIFAVVPRPGRLSRSTVPPIFRSEEHTSEFQSHSEFVCRLLLAKKVLELVGVALYQTAQALRMKPHDVRVICVGVQ